MVQRINLADVRISIGWSQLQVACTKHGLSTASYTTLWLEWLVSVKNSLWVFDNGYSLSFRDDDNDDDYDDDYDDDDNKWV